MRLKPWLKHAKAFLFYILFTDPNEDANEDEDEDEESDD